MFFTTVFAAEPDILISKITALIINPLIKLMIGIAFVVFLYGIVEFIVNANNEEKRNVGKQHIIWGILGMFIMFSVFGLMHILANFWK